MTTIKLVADNQSFEVTENPVVTSGEENTVIIHVDFSEDWDGFGKTAVFFTERNKTTLYEKVMTSGECTVPSEVMVEEGTFLVGIRGVNSSTKQVKTTSLVKYKVLKGTPTVIEFGPTPDVYEDLISAYGRIDYELAVERARIDQLSSLEEGSTTGDAELQDIRVGYDGTIYSSAGNAVRSQVNFLKEDLDYLSNKLKNVIVKGTYAGTSNYLVENVSIPAGDYTISIDNISSSDTDVSISRIFFYYEEGGSKYIDLERNTNIYLDVKFDKKVSSIRFFSSIDYTTSGGDTFTYSGFKLLSDSEIAKNISKIEKNQLNIAFNTVDVVFKINTSTNKITCSSGYIFTPSGYCVVTSQEKSYTSGALKYLYFDTNDSLKFESSIGNDIKIFIAIIWLQNGKFFSNVDLSKFIVNGKRIVNSIIKVGNTSDCDYSNLQSALDNANDSQDYPVTIVLLPGTYTRISSVDGFDCARYISIMGIDRDNTIIKDSTGNYQTPPAKLCLNGTVSNVTFRCEVDSDNYSPDTNNGWCYALHSDYYPCDMQFINCKFESNAGPSVGAGLFEGEKLIFNNCEFISTADGTYNTKMNGAFYVHNYTGDCTGIKQYLEMRNCVAIQEGTPASYGAVLSHITPKGTSNVEYRIQNSIFFANEEAKAQVDWKGTLGKYSVGNNCDNLNS